MLTHPACVGCSIPRVAGEGRAYNLAFLGAARATARRDPQAGAADLLSADRFFASTAHRYGLAVVKALRALVEMQLGRFEQAEALARDAERIAAAAGLGDIVWQVAAARGKALLALGRSGDAETAFRSAQRGIELAGRSLASESTKLRFGIGKEDVARALIRLDVAKADTTLLFRDLERARARVFVDMLADRPMAGGRHAELVQAIRALDADILRQRLLNGAPGGPADGAERERALLTRRERRLAELRGRDPELADTLSVSVVELHDAQARLRGQDLLAYALPGDAEDPLTFLLVSGEGARVAETRLTHEGLARLIREFAATIERRDEGGQRAVATALAHGLDIAGWGPARALHVVPTGALHFVPWGALEVSFPVAVLPTAGWLLRRPIAIPTSAVVIVGDPDFRGAFRQLRGARAEAQEVAAHYGVEALIGSAATEEELRRRVGDGARVLHLATHGTFDATRPLRSAVVLSGRGEPTLLTAARLFEFPLPARLVVLSACETGLGTAVAGDDFLGLARSLYLGGTLTVVSSLWPVDDAGTRVFMRAFHEAARTGDYGTAWLVARDRLRAAGHPPFVYGAFVLGGATGRTTDP